MPDTPTPAYPGRDRLNAAQARFRRGCARLNKEAVRHDPALLEHLSAIVNEAAGHLERLADDATAAENASTRHQRELKAAEDKLRATLRKGVRQGSERAAAVLADLDARRPQNGPRGDDAA
ncbi:hypothetical protein [Streptomyces wuyuanensis]|uniref:hypothetical protein n=1 Tax=Streptomyces wuyuanensis TaxID=1196353 RepID=UPI0037138447